MEGAKMLFFFFIVQLKSGGKITKHNLKRDEKKGDFFCLLFILSDPEVRFYFPFFVLFFFSLIILSLPIPYSHRPTLFVFSVPVRSVCDTQNKALARIFFFFHSPMLSLSLSLSSILCSLGTIVVLPICCRGHVNDMSRICQYRGGVPFSPVNLVSRTCQGYVNMGPFGNTKLL